MSEKKGKPHALRLRKLAEASASETGEEYVPDPNGTESTATVPRDERRNEPQPRPVSRREDGSESE